MSKIGKRERVTQDRVIKLFDEQLDYTFLGDWSDREGNSNIEESLLTAYLDKAKYNKAQIAKALHTLRTEATNANRSLYDNNHAVYRLLRFGVHVKVGAGENTETVKLINWEDPEANDFAIAEEVTLKGTRERRPDLVLYLNGIAVGIIELKSSLASIGDGIRQSISNQSQDFNLWFYSTAQILFAGNDTEGLRYGTIETEEKFWLSWKEDEQTNVLYKLDKYLLKMCDKKRLLELMHDFVLFDGGQKKLPRVHQYFGIKAAQEHIRDGRGGILWHTQGSGKSIVMVLLAKWILENKPNARVAIITDRDALDEQIHSVFTQAGEAPYRASSSRDLISQLGKATPRLLCSLVHKFGKQGLKEDAAFKAYIDELNERPSATVGEVFVFVDECHRTQSGRLHKIMSAMMPEAVFIGFTGTPLLKKDKATTLETFKGGYIHTYKFSEAVDDGVVLDLVYEARNIDQRLGSKEHIDGWFESKTENLNNWQKAALREKWGTMQKVLSSRSRMDQVVADIIYDFSRKRRLSNRRGTAMLVASSIYEACKYFELFQKTELAGKCAVITSYNPQAKDITLEDTGANTQTDKEFVYNVYTDLVKDVAAEPGLTASETYEKKAKSLFKDQPANMRLLVVVDKLLTGFDAPSCTYLYIDKSMQDHGLFQAICRTNRLDGEDKDFGYIVDYMDLFKKVENAIAVYSSELDHGTDEGSSDILMQDRLVKGRERLEDAREAITLLCEPVELPREELQYIHYFCGNKEIPEDLAERESLRVGLYTATVALVRAYANLADDMEQAGFSGSEAAAIRREVEHYVHVRQTIRRASNEELDLKPYEANMRHLIDTYLAADAPRPISPFENTPLLELIVKSGIADAINEKLGSIKNNQGAVAETIANNVRKKIVKEHLNDPAYYDKMSVLLGEILENLKAKQIEYEEYLQQIAELAAKVQSGKADDTPAELDTPGKRAFYNNGITLGNAVALHDAVMNARPDAWRGNQAREQRIKGALWGVLGDEDEVERIFSIVKNQKEY